MRRVLPPFTQPATHSNAKIVWSVVALVSSLLALALWLFGEPFFHTQSNRIIARVSDSQSDLQLPIVVYSNDFEGEIGSEWSERQVEITPIRNRRFLGQFGSESVSLTLTDLPPHQVIKLTFDLFVLRSWDGNIIVDPRNGNTIGPDVWELSANSSQTILRTTFVNLNDPHAYNIFSQAFPGSYPDSAYIPRSCAVENNTLGYSFAYEGIL